jgi:hypothetical protein
MEKEKNEKTKTKAKSTKKMISPVLLQIICNSYHIITIQLLLFLYFFPSICQMYFQ